MHPARKSQLWWLAVGDEAEAVHDAVCHSLIHKHPQESGKDEQIECNHHRNDLVEAAKSEDAEC